MSADTPEIILIQLGNSLGTDSFTYCYNNSVKGYDSMGFLDAAGVAGWVSASSVFSMFAESLYTAFSATMTKIGLYLTGILTPKTAVAFWWQPWLVVGIVVAAVAILLVSIGILYSKRKEEIDKANKKIPNKLKKNGKVDLSKFNNKLPNGQGWKGPDDWKIIKDTARHAAKKWKLYKAKERIASLLEDGTIYGK